MKTTIIAFVAVSSFVSCASSLAESTSDAPRMSRIAGKWVMQSELQRTKARTASRCDLSITIDKQPGKSFHNPNPDYKPYIAILRRERFEPLATGKIQVHWSDDDCVEAFVVIARKDGSLHLCYGPFGGLPRIFLGRGSSNADDHLVIEWSIYEAFTPNSEADGPYVTTVYVRGDAKSLTGEETNSTEPKPAR